MIPDEPQVAVDLCVCAGAASDEFPDLSWTSGGVETRGNSSQRFNKKPSYGVKLDQKASLLGMPKGKKWVLYGPEDEPSLGLRNALAMRLPRAAGSWAPRTRYVSLYLSENEEKVSYQGLYLMMEQIARGKERVDVEKTDAVAWVTEGGEGLGYILKYDNDNISRHDVTVSVPAPLEDMEGLTYVVKYPKKDVAWYMKKYVFRMMMIMMKILHLVDRHDTTRHLSFPTPTPTPTSTHIRINRHGDKTRSRCLRDVIKRMTEILLCLQECGLVSPGLSPKDRKGDSGRL